MLARAQTRQEALALEAVKLRPLLERARADLGPLDGVTVEVDCPTDLTALAQQDLLEQVVTSVAANAAKYTDKGTIRLSACLRGSTVVIEVRDTGRGIDAESRERIFDRFYRIDRDGSSNGFGLGLAIVREVVRAIGGVVEMESEAGVGTTVRVSLAAPGERDV
jgi:two-component system phosphate regulon sensor histidine kinase PhoR